MHYKGLKFSNKSDKTIEIDIEGYIGWDPWDSEKDQINTKEKMKAELKKLAELKAETIIVNINSYGGDVNHGISIHDLLAENKAKIITKINGMTASIATVIAMAGNERRMSDNALILIHNASAWTIGDKNDVKTLAEELEKVDDRIANIYAKTTNKSKEKMLNLMNEDKGRGKWLTADEAKETGLITEVFEPLKATAYFSNEILQRHQLPPVPEKNNNQTENNNIAKQIFDEMKKIIQTNKKPKNQMKQFEAINKTLGVTEMASTDEGVFLNEEQLTTIEKQLNQIEKSNNDLKAAQDALTKAESKITEENTIIQNQNLELEELRKTAGAKTAQAVSQKETIPGKVKDENIVNEKKSFAENLSAIANEFGI